MATRTTNWAGNIAFSAERLHYPRSLEELQKLVAASTRIRPLGTGHSFNRIADTSGEIVSVAGLPRMCVVDREREIVTVSGGIRYGEIAAGLHEAGFALPSLGSLPHISVAGAIATGTHGSGNAVGSLASAVTALQVVTADGQLTEMSRGAGDDEFSGWVVSLGALGVVTRVTLQLVPAFEVRQWVYDDLPFTALADHFDEIFASAYSVSLFTDWRRPGFHQVWLKQRVDEPGPRKPPGRWLGATLANGPRHPIAGMPVENATAQLGVPGPWHARLPHFRMEFTPSSGQELQSEYLVPREHAVDALAAIEGISDRIGPLVQVSEVRTIAAEELWLSPGYGRDTVGIHVTWIPDTAAVSSVLGALEERLSPFDPRPHWGKVFAMGSDSLARSYERYGDFECLMRRYDPSGKFRNELLDQWFPP